MSSDNNHIQAMIHLGNYEEYFILYMDNELSFPQMKMVDEFLRLHPDLQAEFEALLSTRLPMEDFSISKDGLYADDMKLQVIDEEMLLYIDNELPSIDADAFEKKLEKDDAMKLQFAVLQKARLDPAEEIRYPYKKELYRHSTRVMTLKYWMRIAAAVVLVGFLGILFLTNRDKSATGGKDSMAVSHTHPNGKGLPVKQDPEPVRQQPENDIAIGSTLIQPTHSSSKDKGGADRPGNLQMAMSTTPEPVAAVTRRTDEIAFDLESINNMPVTSAPADRKINILPAAALVPAEADKQEDIIFTHRGSVRGILRKATRLIEKRTGIDPTNDKEEILIGVMAIKLN